MRPKEAPRVRGPYQESRGWRLVVFNEKGRHSLHFATESEAQRKKSTLTRKLERAKPRTITNMIDVYLEEKSATGRVLPYVACNERRGITRLLGAMIARDISALTPAMAELLYQQLTMQHTVKAKRPLSAATHRCYLDYAKAFFGWAAKRGYIARSPFAEVRPAGKPSRGKPQLRIEEAQRFIDVALHRFTKEQEPMALAALVALYMGLRAHESLKRQVRDLDANGQVLWVDFGKTRNARRHLSVPATLQPYLRQQCAGKSAEHYLFGETAPGRPRWKQALWVEVRRICQQAKVPVVCTHSLRGLYATLAVESGAVAATVAASLGHGSFTMTERHYAAPESVMNARTARVAGILPSTQSADFNNSELLAHLRHLDSDTLTRLISLAQQAGATPNH